MPCQHSGARMTHVVTQRCIKCRYTDCVDVCPVDCFREGPISSQLIRMSASTVQSVSLNVRSTLFMRRKTCQATSGTLLNLILNYRNAGPASQKAKAHCLMRMNGKTLKTSWICWSANG